MVAGVVVDTEVVIDVLLLAKFDWSLHRYTDLRRTQADIVPGRQCRVTIAPQVLFPIDQRILLLAESEVIARHRIELQYFLEERVVIEIRVFDTKSEVPIVCLSVSGTGSHLVAAARSARGRGRNSTARLRARRAGGPGINHRVHIRSNTHGKVVIRSELEVQIGPVEGKLVEGVVPRAGPLHVGVQELRTEASVCPVAVVCVYERADRDLLIPAIAELRRPRLNRGYLFRHLGVPLLLLGLALRFFSLHRRAFLVQLLLGLYLDLALDLPGRIGRDIRAEPHAMLAALGEHLAGAGIGVERYCPSVLAPSWLRRDRNGAERQRRHQHR